MVLKRRLDHVSLHHQVPADKVRGIADVAVNPAHFCRAHKHVVRLFRSEKRLGVGLTGKVQFTGAPANDVGIALFPQLAHNGGADQAAMTRNIDFSVFSHNETVSFSYFKMLSLPINRV